MQLIRTNKPRIDGNIVRQSFLYRPTTDELEHLKRCQSLDEQSSYEDVFYSSSFIRSCERFTGLSDVWPGRYGEWYKTYFFRLTATGLLSVVRIAGITGQSI